MRLIDADKLPIDDYKYIHRHTIITAPTVEAIPIEWIKEWAMKSENTYNREQIVEMLEDWEKKNETD